MSGESSGITYDNGAANQEYFVASEHYKQAVTYRFTSLGLVLTAISFLLGKDTRPMIGLLGILVLIPIWMIEWRTRILLFTIAKRMIQIEKRWSNATKQKHFMTQFHERDIDMFNGEKIDVGSVIARSLRFPSHSSGIDLIFIAMIIACVLKLNAIEPFSLNDSPDIENNKSQQQLLPSDSFELENSNWNQTSPFKF